MISSNFPAPVFTHFGVQVPEQRFDLENLPLFLPPPMCVFFPCFGCLLIIVINFHLTFAALGF